MTFGLSSCGNKSLKNADCILCTDYANDTYRYCREDFEPYGNIDTWEEYVDYLVDYFNDQGNKGCDAV